MTSMSFCKALKNVQDEIKIAKEMESLHQDAAKGNPYEADRYKAYREGLEKAVEFMLNVDASRLELKKIGYCV